MSIDSTRLTVTPIGIIHSPFFQQEGAPIQPYSAKGVEGSVEVYAPYAEGLADLGGFERVWLVYWFDRACAAKLRVLPQWETREHGVFATRVPARINPIGLSPERLLGVEGTTLHVAEIDILDGTPLLDIKPYVPEYDAYIGLRVGWLDDAAIARGPLKADGRFSKE